MASTQDDYITSPPGTLIVETFPFHLLSALFCYIY